MNSISNERKRVHIISSRQEALADITCHLQNMGFSISQAVDWHGAEWQQPNLLPDLVLLDSAARQLETLVLCSNIRMQYQGPFLLLSNNGDETMHIAALDLGVDDYLYNPSLSLLTAKIRGLLRRSAKVYEQQKDIIILGDLKFDGGRREVSLREGLVELTTIEYDLLWFLARHAGVVLNRNAICRALFHSDYNGFDRSVDLYISQIRQKLGDNPSAPRYVKTVRGVGYLLATPEH